MLIKRKKQAICLLFLYLLSAVIIFFLWTLPSPRSFVVEYDVWNDHNDTFQVFYSDGFVWNETASVSVDYYGMGSTERLRFEVPYGMNRIRIDLGNIPGNVKVSNARLSLLGQNIPMSIDKLTAGETNIISSDFSDGVLDMHAGDDPYICYDLDDELEQFHNVVSIRDYIIKGVVAAALLVVFALAYKYCSAAMSIAKNIIKNIKLVIRLAVSDFKAKYAGNQFGIIWAFIPPAVTALIYIFVFQVIGRAAPIANEYPYSLWLLPGLIPWFYFSESVSSSTNCLVEYSYLVKKIMFNVEVLPIVKIISSFFVHVFLTLFVLIVYIIAGCPIKIEMIQIFYYVICNTALSVAFGYLTCSLLPFFKDMGQIINLILMVGMWACPIMWDMNILTEDQAFLKVLIKLNPMYYIVNGYRESFMGTAWFTDNLIGAVYFWSVVLCLFVINTKIFKKVQPHFSDVL